MFKIKFFFIIFIFFFVSFAYVYAKDECSNIKTIYKNMDFCDKKDVSISGKISNVQFYKSRSGNKYTVFMLNDFSASPIKIFSYEHLEVSNNDIIEVKGVFNKIVLKKGYSFPMQVTTTVKKIHILKKSKFTFFLYIVLVVVFFIFLFILKKKKKRKKIITTAGESNLKEDKKDDNYNKGLWFERKIEKLFKITDWTMHDITKDISKKFNRRIETDSNPDLIFRHNVSQKLIAIECKWRSSFIKGYNGKYGTAWAGKHQIENYKKFQKEKKIPVCIIIGTGRPLEKLFLLPLDYLQFQWVNENYLLKYKKNIKKSITVEDFQNFYKEKYFC